MISEYWKELIEDIEDISKQHVVIRVFTDIVKSDYGYKLKDYYYYIIIGHDSDEISKTLEEFNILDILKYPSDVQEFKDLIKSDEIEGEYECLFILRKIRDEGYSYYDISEYEIQLIRTLKERERDYKFDYILDGFDFNI